MKRFIKQCPICENRFIAYPSRPQKFCSQKCAKKSPTRHKEKICVGCHAIFVPNSIMQIRCGSLSRKMGCSFSHYIKRKTDGNIKKRFKLLEKYNFTCQYCGRKAPSVVLNIDHVLAIKNGGSNDDSNLTVACRDCNQGKGDFLLSVQQSAPFAL